MAISITKPTVGGSEDTWGTQINAALDTMVTAINDNTTDIATNTADIISNVFPAGGIIMWSGSIANIPAGWYLCDGNNGTPNLTGKFIVHADADSGGTYAPGDTGGADTVALSEAEMPSHTHSVSGTTNTTGAHSHTVTTLGGPSNYMEFSVASYILGNTTRTTSVAGDHSHTVSGTAAATGSGDAHENRPPYYALAYIMKT